MFKFKKKKKKRLTLITNDEVVLKLIAFRLKFSRCSKRGVASFSFLFGDVFFGAVLCKVATDIDSITLKVINILKKNTVLSFPVLQQTGCLE